MIQDRSSRRLARLGKPEIRDHRGEIRPPDARDKSWLSRDRHMTRRCSRDHRNPGIQNLAVKVSPSSTAPSTPRPPACASIIDAPTAVPAGKPSSFAACSDKPVANRRPHRSYRSADAPVLFGYQVAQSNLLPVRIAPPGEIPLRPACDLSRSICRPKSRVTALCPPSPGRSENPANRKSGRPCSKSPVDALLTTRAWATPFQEKSRLRHTVKPRAWSG